MGVINKGIMRALNLARNVSSPREALDAPLRATPFGVQKALERYQPRKTPSRTVDLMANPAVSRRMDEAIERGVGEGGHKWYDTAPILAAFIKELGPEEGQVAFRRYMDFVGATSAGQSPGPNVRKASWAYSHDRQGFDVPDYPPHPYSSNTDATQQRMIRQIQRGEGFKQSQAKVASFAENLKGNQTPVAVDRHALALPAIFSEDPRFLQTSVKVGQDEVGDYIRVNPRKMVAEGQLDFEDTLERPAYWGGRPLETEYGALEQYYRDLAERHGLTPAQAQAAAWVGGADVTGVWHDGGGAMVDVLKDRLAHTARVRDLGESEDDVLRAMIRGQRPLLAVPIAAGGALGALASRRDTMGT